ncbi:MAG TPA: PIG-L family deacetylase [Vicinamibacterales bacterium]|nr:PIG-L family deacetylase [Vicinamibacterales bacterium]
MRARHIVSLALLGCVVATWVRADAQVRPVYDMGAAGLVQALQRLTTTASVLHTGAHPDDEDSAFLARAARGDHARVAYLSLTRGEGGQNIIGPELFDALGVIRTEELLQARRLDGAEQLFTRAFDFGFSKTRAETGSRWNEQDVLRDMVRHIRAFRPLVIYSRFSGTPDDGHGHHQMAGYLTPLAFKAAADPAMFPELAREGLRPWQARKLYRGGGRPEPNAGPVLQVATGTLSPLLGRTYAEVAAEGRSQHKSQEMGSIEWHGPSTTGLRLLESRVGGAGAERSVFDGIDVSIRGLAALAGLPASSLDASLSDIERLAQEALNAYEPLDPSGSARLLAQGLQAVSRARSGITSINAPEDARAHADFLLARKEQEFTDALIRATGVLVDPLASSELLIPGEAAEVTIRTFAPDERLSVTGATLRAPGGWTVEALPAAAGGTEPRGGRREVALHTARYRVIPPADAPPTEPYFLSTPRAGDLYQWPEGGPQGLPFAPPILTADVSLVLSGTPVTISRGVQYRYADGVRGELRRDVNVAPALSVALDSPLLIVPTGSTPRTQRITAAATSHTSMTTAGVLRLRLPTGWKASPAQAAFTLRKGETFSAPFTITAPPVVRDARLQLQAEAAVGGQTFTREMQVVAYPHIQTHRLYAPSAAIVQVLHLDVAPVRVGYIMGSGDKVPDALRRMGVNVTMLDDKAIATGNLSRFDTIVVGIRATEARPAFVAHQRRLREYMENGGTLIVQYQQPEYAMLNLPPFPVQAAGNSRVTNEAAPITILAPRHPVFTFPNRITAADFDGWVQERNLYGFTSFDAKYTPLLQTADPGEQPQRGAELYARVGKGQYVYTAYAWFRQLEAGVPGAYRLFANLISLSRAPQSPS